MKQEVLENFESNDLENIDVANDAMPFNEDPAELFELLNSNREAAILCKTKERNPHYFSIVAANSKFYETFSLGEENVIGRNYDFLLDELDVDSSRDDELDHVHLIKMVKNFTPCLVIANIKNNDDEEDEENAKDNRCRIAFNPLKIEKESDFHYATFTFQKIAEGEVKKSNNGNAQNAVLLRNLERKLRDESMLREIVSLIVSDSSINDVAQKIAKILCEGLKVDRCILHDFNNERVNFAVEYVVGGATHMIGERGEDHHVEFIDYIDFQNHFFEKLNDNSGKSFAAVMEDVASDQAFEPVRAICNQFDIKSQISVNTKFKGTMNGAIYIHQNEKRHWLPNEVELVTMVADQFAIAIERSIALERIVTTNHELMESGMRLKESLEHEQEMRKMQNEFVALVSHEFKTPLQIIDSTREVMVRKVKALTLPDDALDKALDRIKGAIQRMNGLIHSTLNLAKLENGDKALKLEVAKFDLHELIEEIIRKNAILATNKNIEIATKIEELPRAFFGDSKLLDHTFTNVISNAIKYSRNDSVVKILAKANDKKVALRVIDQGIGIPKEDIENIGKKFFRAKNTMSVAGTGIGLYLAKHFVEMHGGEVLIESELNVGTSFTVILPINSQSQ